MLHYELPCGWQISMPDAWLYEEEDGQSIFYPSDSDLTVRITPFHAERDNVPAPVELMEAAYINSVPASAKPCDLHEYALDGFSIKAYGEKSLENGQTVYAFYVGYYTAGELLTVNIFSTNKTECTQALEILRTIRWNRL